MEIITNPVLVAVVVLCVLCLLKLNVLMSLIISALAGALIGGISIPEAMKLLCSGFSRNADTALSYILLGTFATAIATSGLADMFSKKLSRVMGRNGKIVLLIIAGIGCFSQNLVPVHIAFIPILIPPMLSLFNELKIDRRAAALGDAGSPASDSTLGPTSGLNADGQHNHIWDTCVPTFIHFNIPLMLAAIIFSQFIRPPLSGRR